MLNQYEQEELNENVLHFLVELRNGKWGDFTRYLTSDLAGMGTANSQAFCVVLERVYAGTGKVPTLQEMADSWLYLYQQGQLFPVPVQPAQQPRVIIQQPPDQPKSAIEQQAELMAKEIVLMAKQRRPEASKPAGPSMREMAEQHAKDESDWQSFKSEMATAQAINVIGYQGNINWAATNTTRAVAIQKCKDDWSKKCPKLAEKISQHSTTAPTTSGGFTPLPLDADAETMRRSTPAQIRELIRRRQVAEAAKHSEPNHDAW